MRVQERVRRAREARVYVLYARMNWRLDSTGDWRTRTRDSSLFLVKVPVGYLWAGPEARKGRFN